MISGGGIILGWKGGEIGEGVAGWRMKVFEAVVKPKEGGEDVA